MPVSPVATALTTKRVRTTSSSARRPSELATRMRRRTSPYPALTCLTAAPVARAAASALWSSSTLRALATVSGRTVGSYGRAAYCGVRAISLVPPPPERAAAPAASAAARRPASLRSAVWANPVVSPTTTRMPAPRSRPDTSSSTLPSSRRADDERRSSTNTSAKSPPLRSASPSTRRMADSSSKAVWYRRAVAYRTGRASHPHRVPGGHCRRAALGRGARAGHAPGGGAGRGGHLCRRAGRPGGGPDHRRHASAARPLGAERRRRPRHGRGHVGEGGGPPPRVHGVRERRPRPHRRREDHPRRGGDRRLHEAGAVVVRLFRRKRGSGQVRRAG